MVKKKKLLNNNICTKCNNIMLHLKAIYLSIKIFYFKYKNNFTNKNNSTLIYVAYLVWNRRILCVSLRKIFCYFNCFQLQASRNTEVLVIWNATVLICTGLIKLQSYNLKNVPLLLTCFQRLFCAASRGLYSTPKGCNMRNYWRVIAAKH